MVIGYVAAKIFSGKEEKDRGIIPSVVFSVRGYNIHLHHWFIAIGAMVAAFWLNFFLFSPVVFYGFLGGIAVQGIFQYDDWRKVITRRRKA
jgi:hypothetical protein